MLFRFQEGRKDGLNEERKEGRTKGRAKRLSEADGILRVISQCDARVSVVVVVVVVCFIQLAPINGVLMNKAPIFQLFVQWNLVDFYKDFLSYMHAVVNESTIDYNCRAIYMYICLLCMGRTGHLE